MDPYPSISLLHPLQPLPPEHSRHFPACQPSSLGLSQSKSKRVPPAAEVGSLTLPPRIDRKCPILRLHTCIHEGASSPAPTFAHRSWSDEILAGKIAWHGARRQSGYMLRRERFKYLARPGRRFSVSHSIVNYPHKHSNIDNHASHRRLHIAHLLEPEPWPRHGQDYQLPQVLAYYSILWGDPTGK